MDTDTQNSDKRPGFYQKNGQKEKKKKKKNSLKLVCREAYWKAITQ